MVRRAREQDGFMVIEVVAAIVILSIALMALMAGYDSAFISLHKAGQKSTAATLMNTQLERYSALPYTALGLNPTLVTAVGDSTKPTYDALYATNALLDGTAVVSGQTVESDGTVNDYTQGSACTSDQTTPTCMPIQTVTGADGRSYRIETFITQDASHSQKVGLSNVGWTTMDVSVIVRDATDNTQLVEAQTSFYSPPSS
jgi:type II secretory pathway pseudopilin PulG